MNRKFVAKSNFVLRRVLNTKENIDILIEFIEVILNIKIKEATINPYLEKRKENLPAEENFGIADLRVKTNEGKEINIGIQIIDGEHVLTKIFLYFAQIHVYQLDHDIKRKIVETKTINILDFIVTKSKEYHSRMILDNKKSFERLRMDLSKKNKLQIEYPPMKLMDMCMWQIGYDLNEEGKK